MTQQEFDSLSHSEKKAFLESWNDNVADIMYEVAEEVSEKANKAIEYEQTGQSGIYCNEFYSDEDVCRVSDEDIVKHFGVAQIEFIPLDQLKAYLIEEVTSYYMK